MLMPEGVSEVAQFMVENGAYGICIGIILLCLIGDFRSGGSHDMINEFSMSRGKEVSDVLSNVAVLIFVWHSYSIDADIRLLIDPSD
jgi:hypothetical protein